MAKTPDDLREDLPEFQDAAVYTDDALKFWLDAAYEDLNPAVFGNVLDRAAEIFAAHFLVLGQRNVISSRFGKVPGDAVGVVTSRSVDKAAVSYDSSMISEKGAGFWNLTSYGLRFWWMLRTRAGATYRAPCDGRNSAW